VIRAVMMGKTGPIYMLGVTEENVRRLKSGMPIDVDLKPMIASTGGASPDRLVISYGVRHVDVVADMERGGLPVPERLREQAVELDNQLERERRTYRHEDAPTAKPPVASQGDDVDAPGNGDKPDGSQ
jgi:hypothetical protein